MCPAEVELVRKHADRFRTAIDATDLSDVPLNLNRFPHDCCHHTCKLLSLYLRDQGLGCFDIISGTHPAEGKEHLWLQRDRLVVDLTADQFADGPARVIVASDSAWHNSFDGRRSRVLSEKVLDEWAASYEDLYGRIVKRLPGE